MKSKKSVILIWALLCCIPAASFFLFRPKGDALGGYTPKTTTSWPVQIDAREYRIALEPDKAPLQQGHQNLHLVVHAADGKAVPKLSKVEILMPMENELMTAPVETRKLEAPDTFEIKTFFSMAGAWQLFVTPDTADKPIQVDFWVEQ